MPAPHFHGNTKCGCVYCKTGGAPTTRAGWKAQRNKKGKIYGNHA